MMPTNAQVRAARRVFDENGLRDLVTDRLIWFALEAAESVAVSTAEELVVLMRASGGGCYLGRDGRFYMEYRRGEVSQGAIETALERGLIKPRWPETSHAYWDVA